MGKVSLWGEIELRMNRMMADVSGGIETHYACALR